MCGTWVKILQDMKCLDENAIKQLNDVKRTFPLQIELSENLRNM